MTQVDLIKRLNELIKDNTSNQRSRANIATDIAGAYIKETGAVIKKQIISELDAAYNKDGLQILARYAAKLVKADADWLDSLSLNMPYSLLLKSDIQTANKAKLVWAVAFLFCHPEVFRRFHAQLPRAHQQVAERLAWVPQAKAAALESLVGAKLVSKSTIQFYGSPTELSGDFKLIPHTGTGWNGIVVLAWPPGIRAFLQTVYPQPDDFKLKTIPGPDPAWRVWDEGETVIFDEIQQLVAYRLQDSIVVTNAGKVNPVGLKKMRKLLGVREFFDADSAFPLLRTTCLAQMMVSVTSKKEALSVDSLELLKLIYEVMPKQLQLLFLLTSLKNHGFVNFYHYHQQAELVLTEWLQRLPVGEWVSIENILSYAQLNELSALPCDPHQLTTLTYERPAQHNPGYLIKANVMPGVSYEVVERPTLLAGFFLCAALGWLDIAYVEPTGQFGVDYYSAYDGLKAVRLTNLGGYLAGRLPAYTPGRSPMAGALRFDEQSLLIFCDPGQAVAETMLANYAERVSPTCFRVSAGSFLKDCKTKKQLLNKINLFKQSIAPDLSSNWQTFFDELTNRAEPLQVVTDLTTYQFAPANQSLIRLLAQDAVLKTMVVKAEGFRVLVATAELPKFKNRLRELGYLLP
jgi:hypothetical protein